MFEGLQESLKRAFKTLTGTGKLTEANMREGLDLVRDALLNADVSFEVAKDFLARVSEKALGQKVLTSVRPTEQLLNLVYEELVALMGQEDFKIPLSGDLTILMLCGLQGSGKTTTCGKLAKLLLDQKQRPMLAAADLQRPAAIEQLRVLGEQVGVPVHLELGATNPVAVCQNAVQAARQKNCNILILDTAGRLHVDEDLMRELAQIDNRVQPHQVYLVVDGNTGQDAINSAKAFNAALELNGAILTKLDGASSAGAALSVRHVTGVPIKFIGTGEHLIDLEPFRPTGIAQRILGGGDLMELIRRSQMLIDAEQQKEMERKLLEGKMTLEDFRSQLGMIGKMGSIDKLMGMIPGMGDLKKQMAGANPEEDMKRLRGIIDAMTKVERKHHDPVKFIDMSRRRRIAAGAGVEPQEVNELIKQFDTMSKLMKQLTGMNMFNRMGMLNELSRSGALLNPGGIAKPKGDTGKRLTNEEKKKNQKDREREAREARKKRRESKDRP